MRRSQEFMSVTSVGTTRAVPPKDSIWFLSSFNLVSFLADNGSPAIR